MAGGTTSRPRVFRVLVLGGLAAAAAVSGCSGSQTGNPGLVSEGNPGPVSEAQTGNPGPVSEAQTGNPGLISQVGNPGPVAEAGHQEAFPCAGLICREFSPGRALGAEAAPSALAQAAAFLLAQKPLALGFGEAHMPKGFTGASTVARFTDELLPHLTPPATSLVVELLVPPKGCDEETAAVKKEASEVTQGQSQENQNEYVRLGQKAKSLKVLPEVLRASCDDLAAISSAGDEGIVVMMETIARLSVTTSAALQTATPGLVLLYGGALHNDVAPRPAFESWSYAKQLTEATSGHYLEVDLVVPELVQDTPSWQKFSWYAAYRALPVAHGVTLIETSKDSYALVFPAAH